MFVLCCSSNDNDRIDIFGSKIVKKFTREFLSAQYFCLSKADLKPKIEKKKIHIMFVNYFKFHASRTT